MTSVIDRLESAGYALRRHDLNDRRKVAVDATDLLIRREQQVFGELQSRLEQLAQTYSDAELSIVQDLLERSRELVVRTHQATPAAVPQPEGDDAALETSTTPCG